MIFSRLLVFAAIAATILLSGCATTKAPQYDYAAYQKSKPTTLLVMPPINESPDVKATPAVWAQATLPLSEAGYYVLPVTLVDETFKQNGVNSANEAADIPYQKLRDVFGADAAVYIKVKKYGTSYAVLASETRVEVQARIIDLRSGELLWEGSAAASSAEQRQQNQGGLAGLLVEALVNQIIGTATDAAFNFAGIANQRMLAPRYNGVLPGPRSSSYGQVPTQ